MVSISSLTWQDFLVRIPEVRGADQAAWLLEIFLWGYINRTGESPFVQAMLTRSVWEQ
jgi:hypothetical protein